MVKAVGLNAHPLKTVAQTLHSFHVADKTKKLPIISGKNATQ